MIEEEQTSMQDDGPFVFMGDDLALDLVNTEIMHRGKRLDLLTTPEMVARWWKAARQHNSNFCEIRIAFGDTTIYDQTLLATLKTLRTALRAIFSALVSAKTPAREDID